MAAATNVFPNFLLGRRWRAFPKLVCATGAAQILAEALWIKAHDIVTTATAPLLPAKAA